jgi:hypothetical protein
MLRRVETQITKTGQKIKAEIRQILTEIILSHAKDDRAPLLNVAARHPPHNWFAEGQFAEEIFLDFLIAWQPDKVGSDSALRTL